MSDDLAFMPATELLQRYRARSLSPVEATKAVLARIDALNPKLNAYCLVDHAAALEQAKESEQRWSTGKPKGRLDGVPTSIKDLVLTKGWPTLRGSRTVDPHQPWDEDAPATARLREHGAVLIGKTTTPEFGWKGVTDSPLTGITRNPWNLERTPGGSSGGASAQVAAGLGQLAIGSDGGGSIRIPSGFAGIFGLKPSFGRVPAWPASPMGTLSHIGPMTRTVGDAALMLTVLAEPDVRDWMSLPYDGTEWSQGLNDGVKGLKIAYSPRLGYAKVHPEVAAAVAEAANAMVSLGAHVEETDPGFADPVEIYWTHWIVGAYGGMRGLSPAQRAMLEPDFNAVIDAGAKAALSSYLEAVSARFALGMQMRKFHQRYDLLLTPALAVPAFQVGQNAPEPPFGGSAWTKWTPFTYPFNLTQQPAASVPCGFTADGLPIGLQIVGPMHRDDLVLRAAAAYQAAYSTLQRRPPLA